MESGSVQFSSVQSLSVSDCLRPDELQLAKPPESGRGFLFKSFVVTGAGYLLVTMSVSDKNMKKVIKTRFNPASPIFLDRRQTQRGHFLRQ